MVTLVIDTSTQFLNLALIKQQQVLSSISKRVKSNHSEHVMVEINQLLAQQDLTVQNITVIAVSQGPGSYTGLRIGITVAKMLAYALSIPIYQFSSLALLSLQGQEEMTIPLIDARRQAVYAGYYQQGQAMAEDEYITLEQLITQLNKQNKPVCFVADEAEALLSLYKDNLTIPYKIMQLTSYDLTDINHLQFIESDAFNLKPSYLRISEAEANLLKVGK